MDKLPSKQEWIILETLWKKSPVFLSELMREMKNTVNWKQTTFSTYLKKMFNAGLIGYETISGNRSYYPIVKREECVREESRSLREKLSDVSTKLLLACMIRESGLKEQDCEELSRLIAELDSDGKR